MKNEDRTIGVSQADLERLCYGVALEIISGLEHSCVLEEDGKKIAYGAVGRFLREREVTDDVESSTPENGGVPKGA